MARRHVYALVAAAGLLLGLQGSPAGAAAPPSGVPAKGIGCGFVLDTTYNPATGRYELVDQIRGGHRTYDLNGATSGPGTLVTDDDNVWCDTPAQADAVLAHVTHARFWDYFLDVHGRKGARGDGRAGCSRVHYGTSSPVVFHSDLDGCVTYGGGQGSGRWSFPVDLGLHEWAHGVTSATANLVFSGEPGGLNEATSDIFAVSAGFHAARPEAPGNYLIGEDTDILGNGLPLRRMDRPSWDGASKDSWYPGIGGIDVHHSSGPANHFFYLLAEGSGRKVINGVQYDSPTADGVPVRGIGREAAGRIWYRALTTRMTERTTYAQARTATLAAAAGLYGADSTAYRATAAAWAAVGVRGA
ncbi:hypothetical protein GCM10010218_20270 [Streptomyces mashuensis]|uniref:Neutral metalloproteinase n=1 Tax=Streptomyces mashuensis TaxID=33904 RepID=A0A919B306_9ACTN|nr:M4 family metallopeptidase [Streptomyces mashuensis]GHF38954.1 hypothetical protein GCM10010218_20270 [Streptomyces mashuensis]